MNSRQRHLRSAPAANLTSHRLRLLFLKTCCRSSHFQITRRPVQWPDSMNLGQQAITSHSFQHLPAASRRLSLAALQADLGQAIDVDVTGCQQLNPRSPGGIRFEACFLLGGLAAKLSHVPVLTVSRKKTDDLRSFVHVGNPTPDWTVYCQPVGVRKSKGRSSWGLWGMAEPMPRQ